MPKAPPRPYRPPAPPPTARRIYGHVDAGSWSCPRCGELTLAGGRGRRRSGGGETRGYDPQTGHFRCRGCGYGAYIGLVLWPTRGQAIARPGDHVLTPGEAAALRLALSMAETRGGGANRPPGVHGEAMRRLVRTNRECTCGVPCAVHDGERAPAGEADAGATIEGDGGHDDE